MAWRTAARVADLKDDDVIGVVVDAVPVALYRMAGEVYATHDICTHAHACLSEGYFEDGRIECPLHQATYDVRTGAAVCGPADGDLRTYPVRIEGAEVQVDLDGVLVER